MASVDQRVVSMQFDNKSFEENVGTTISSVDKLKKSLNFDEQSKSLNGLSAAGKSFELSGLSGIASSVEHIASRFGFLGITAISVINSIVERAVTAGINLTKSLSVGQILDGYREYETNIKSIQTILANTKSKGTGLEDVNKALDILNEYSDQTIYNFGEMTRNIGTFTAAGIDLDTSVSAIKGIANLAAISGSSSQQASVAMYQLSQALASGTVKLIDWNSVVNAGLGGEVFQKALFESGKALKTIKNVPLKMTFEEWKKAGNSFRGSLQDGWITSQVLTNTLQGFTGDLTDAQLKSMGYNEEQIKQIQELGETGKDAATKVKTLTQLISTVKESLGSGWSQSFRTIIGDFEEAKNVFTTFSTAIGQVVERSSSDRNRLLLVWKVLGGREALINSITNSFSALGKIVTTVRSAFYDIFPQMTANRLYWLTRNLEDFTKRLTLSEGALNAVRKIFGGIFALFRIGIEVVKGIVSVFSNLFDGFSGLDTGNTGILGFFANLGQKVIDFKKAFVDTGKIQDFFDDLTVKIREAIKWIIEAKNAIVEFYKESVSDKINTLSEATDRVRQRFEFLYTAINKVVTVSKDIIEKFKNLKEYFQKFEDFIKEQFSQIPQKIADVFAKADYSQVLDTVNTGLFAGLLGLLAKFLANPFKFGQGFIKDISEALKTLTSTLETMQKNLKAQAIERIAIAIALLAGAVLIFSLMDSKALTKAMVAVSVGLGVLIGALTLMNKLIFGPKVAAKLVAVSGGLVLISAAILILSLAMRTIATLSWSEILRGLTGIAGLLVIVTLAAAVLSKTVTGSSLILTGAGLIEIAIALNILAGAVKLFSLLSYKEIFRGLTGVGLSLAAIAIALQLMPNGLGTVLKGAGILEIAFALNILAGAVKLFSMMSPDELKKGLVAATAALLGIALATQMMPNGASLALQGAGILLISIGLLAIAKSIQMISTLSWEEISKGLVGIAGTLFILALAVNAMNGALPGAVAIAIVTASLLVLAGVVKAFANLSWSDLLHGIVGIAAALGTLAVAALLIGPILPQMLGLGIALAIIGAGMVLIGAGATLVAYAISILVTSVSRGADVLGKALVIVAKAIPPILVALGEGIIKLAAKLLDALPGLLAKLSDSIDALLQLIIDNLPKLGLVLIKLVDTLLKVINESTPKIIAAGLNLIKSLLTGIRDNIKEIVILAAQIIVNFVDGITEKLPDIINSGVNLLIAFINGIADNLYRIANAVLNLIDEFVKQVARYAYRLGSAGGQILKELLKGVANSIKDIADGVQDIVDEFAKVLTEKIPSLADTMFDALTEMLNSLADTIREKSGALGEAIGNVVSAIVESLGIALRAGIIEVVKRIIPGGGLAVRALEWLGIISEEFKGTEKNVESSSDKIQKESVKIESAMVKTSKVLEALANTEISLDPVITPVVDMTNVIDSAAMINSLLTQTPATAIVGQVSYDQAATIASTPTTPTEVATPTTTTTEIKFEQNNYSPEALSTADIYRQTRNQIALAKEELAVV